MFRQAGEPHPGDPGDAQLLLEGFTPYRLVVLGRRMSESLGAAYAGEGLTIPEWRVLAVVSQVDEMAARDVVARTPMDKMAVSRAIVSLETKGLVRRSRDVGDRRVSFVRLSPNGRAVFTRVARIALDYENAALASFTVMERRQFAALLAKLEARMDEIGSGLR